MTLAWIGNKYKHTVIYLRHTSNHLSEMTMTYSLQLLIFLPLTPSLQIRTELHQLGCFLGHLAWNVKGRDLCSTFYPRSSPGRSFPSGSEAGSEPNTSGERMRMFATESLSQSSVPGRELTP